MPTGSLAKLYARAVELGWRCVSSTWCGHQTSYEFECTRGHRFERHAVTVLYQSPSCPGCDADAIRERWIATLAARGGELVEGVFTGLQARSRLRCANGHEWDAQGRKISEGSWCRHCAADASAKRNLRDDGLEALQAAAHEKGGRCLSTTYAGSAGIHELECSQGHRWQATGGHILRGHWCPQCASRQRGERRRRPDGLQQLQGAAAAQGGVCLSERYPGRNSRYRFRCVAGHEWQSAPATVLRGAWCARCQQQETESGARARLHAVAAAKGWKCLTENWQGYDARYTFICSAGHRFERHAKDVLYRDGSCSACEADALRERWMATLSDRGGSLVEGTFTGMQARYRLRCAHGHEWEARGSKISDGSWCPRCAADASAKRNLLDDGLERLQAAAREKGGRCLATAYAGVRGRYEFECAQGHRWSADGGDVMRGSWCMTCARKAAGATSAALHFYHDGLQRLQAVARSHGGICLAKEYVGAPHKYPFRCAQGHEWNAVASQIWRGHWCLACAHEKRKLTIDDLQELAAARGGRCLSETYLSMREKHMWECHLCHVWMTTIKVIKAGGWCPNYAILQRTLNRKKRLKWDYEGRA